MITDDQIVGALAIHWPLESAPDRDLECFCGWRTSLQGNYPSHLAEVIEPIIKARELEAKANALETFDFDLFARCLGGDAAWVTTATKVGDLVGLWLRDEAEAYRAEATS